jgi:NADPH-dependent 2,4-dienoyl-CoA reductase/sulfur reductase-like enzyme
MSAASQARRLRSADELEIVAFERGSYTSYSACGIPYLVAGDVEDAQRLVARPPEVFREQYAIDVRLGHEVVAIDTEGQTVTVRDSAANSEANHHYDDLVIATGATPVRPALPGVNARGVFGVQTLDDGTALLRYLEERAPRRAVVVGGGYIGLEMAEAMVRRGITTSLVEGSAQVMATLDADMAVLIADALRSVGVDLRLGQSVGGFAVDADGAVEGVQLGDEVIPAEVVVLGIGVRPNSGLADDAGITIGTTHGIATDARMATSARNVWAAGDCVETHHRVSGKPVTIALGTHANKQGRVAGANLAGGSAEFGGVLGTAVSKVCAYEVARTGLNEREAAAAGIDAVAATIDSTTRAGYFPGAAPITVKMVMERITGRLLGAQIVGREGAAKRIDIVAVALWNGMTAAELSGVDLGYAPPFSPVYDPVLVAARRVADAGTGR